ncbi:site-specific integrase [Bacteroides uniformis]|uniref:site-specific integrase n=1 Tax=Bacteroides uniformis TaxID=820 RepID=UPI00216AE3FA
MSTVRVIQNKQRLTKEGNAPLYITFYLGKEKLMLPCKVSVPAAKFDEKSGLLKGNSKEAKDINLIVSNLKARVNDILVKFRLRNQALTKDIFMREYNNPSDYKTFHDFVKEHMKTYSRRIEMGTFKHHLSCMKKFKAYNELLQFQDLTPDYLTDYLIYMKKELGNTEITAQRNMSTIKIYVTAAYRKGYIEENPFQEFHIKRIKSDVDYLTEEELMQFVQLYYQRTLPEKLQLTLAFFLFMCFTSMHITDARMFCIEQVNNDVLTYYRVKNRNCKPEPIKIPMPVPAEKLLEEWAEGREEGRLFRNVQCDQVVNRQLKAIAKELGINKYRPRQEDIRLQLFISGKQKTYPACKNCLDIAISGKR